MFKETLKLIDDAGLTYLHVFPYSPRPETPAAKMPQIDPQERKIRAATLRQKGERTKAGYFQTLSGQTAKILVERQNQGYTETYAPVRLTNQQQPGTIISALITKFSAQDLTAEIIATPI
jgi:threonylcarbamoyladenosine tRNA methylthiotransferase MtaB